MIQDWEKADAMTVSELMFWLEKYPKDYKVMIGYDGMCVTSLEVDDIVSEGKSECVVLWAD